MQLLFSTIQALFLFFLLSLAMPTQAQPPEKTFPALAERPSKTSESLMQEAIAHYDGGRYRTCLGLLTEALNINKEGQLSDILHYYKALTHIQLKEYDAALTQLDTAILFNNSKGHYFYYRGDLRLQKGLIADSEADFRQCLALQQNYAQAWLKLGVILQQKSQLREALIAYDKAIALDEKNAEAYYLRGLIMLQVGMPDKGCADLGKASDLGSQLAEKAKQQYCR